MAIVDNCVAYYKLDSGALTTDSVASYTLTDAGTVAEGTTFLGTASADFGTSNSTKRLYSSTDHGITATGAISLSFWVKMRTEISTDEQCFTARSYINASGTSIQINYQYNAGTRRIRFLRYGSSNSLQYYTITLGTSNWAHIVATFDGSTIKGYVNGTEVTTEANSGTQSIGGTAFGIAANGTTQYASALIDEYGVWSRALSGAEVTSLYNSGSGLAYPFASTYTGAGFMALKRR
jgi:hypothetical protein